MSDDVTTDGSLERDVLLAGGLAGTLGAGVMAVLAMLLGTVAHGDPWYAPRLVGGVFFRHAPTGDVAVLLGFAVHFATAGGLATAFASMVPRGGTALAPLMLGFLFALALQAVMPSLVVPWASPPLARAEPSPAALFLLHLSFGACLGALPAARRALLRLTRLRHRAAASARAPR
ncbi:hypothetical protein [Myxococcus hansupus]|uniref:hypothetical protein n=1 Tax=Pseudomyxococcus hansupus TaxID=1297742 RepID=UPI0006769E4A|nr:hypothetical protein [Myxococcus hansupus]